VVDHVMTTGTVSAEEHERLRRSWLHVDQSRQAGVVFHMISCLTELGRVGLTAVGDSPEEASRRYREAERILLDDARWDCEETPLPG